MARRADALARVRTKSFLASCLVGVGAGCLTGWYGQTLGLVGGAVTGLLAVVVAGQAGGFMGMFVGQALSLSRGGPGSGTATDAVQLVSCFGGFLGLVASLVALQWEQAAWWAAAGSLAAGFAGGAAGDLADVLLRLSVLDEARDDERAAQARRDKGGGELQVELLDGEFKHPRPFPDVEPDMGPDMGPDMEPDMGPDDSGDGQSRE